MDDDAGNGDSEDGDQITEEGSDTDSDETDYDGENPDANEEQNMDAEDADQDLNQEDEDTDQNPDEAGISFVLNETELVMKKGETFQLTAVLKGNTSDGTAEGEESEDGTVEYSVEWESSNDSIVRVDGNGLLTAVKVGTAVIKAYTEGYDENYDYYEYSAECKVTVVAEKEGKCGDNLTWKIDEEGNLVVSGTGTMYDYDYEWDYDKDKYVSTSPFADFTVKTATFENGVTSIGDYAFRGQDQLVSIAFYPSLTSIDEYSFRGCIS